MNKSQKSNHIPKKLERVQPGQKGAISNYDQLAYGVFKPPSAKSAARRFNQKGSGSSGKLLSNIQNQEQVKLTKDSLKKFDSQIKLKLLPEQVVSLPNQQQQQQSLSWAKNQKVNSPKKNQQSHKNMKRNKNIQEYNNLNKNEQILLPEQATFGKPAQLDQFTFGKNKIGDQTKDIHLQSKIPKINNQAKIQSRRIEQSTNQNASSNRVPSVPNRSKILKINSNPQRNKSQASIRRKLSEKAISQISQRSQKQSISVISQETKLNNLRMKYGNPNVKKVRPMVPRPDDPYQIMLEKQQQYLLAKKKSAAISLDNQKIDGKHNFVKSNSKQKLSNKPPQPNKNNYKNPLPQSTASQAAARDININQHFLSQLKNVNFEQAKIQNQLVRMHIQTHQKKEQILQKNNIKIDQKQKSSDLFKKLIDRPLPKKPKIASNNQIDIEEQLKDSLANLDDLLIRHNIKWKKEQELARQHLEQKKRDNQRKIQQAKI